MGVEDEDVGALPEGGVLVHGGAADEAAVGDDGAVGVGLGEHTHLVELDGGVVVLVPEDDE